MIHHHFIVVCQLMALGSLLFSHLQQHTVDVMILNILVMATNAKCFHLSAVGFDFLNMLNAGCSRHSIGRRLGSGERQIMAVVAFSGSKQPGPIKKVLLLNHMPLTCPN